MLQAVCLPQGRLAVLPIGQEASPQWAGSLLTGQVRVRTVTINGVAVQTAAPVVHTVMAPTETALEAMNGKVAALGTKVVVMQYQGRRPQVLEPGSGFREAFAEITRFLTAPLFKNHLGQRAALAQALMAYQLHADRLHHGQIARVLTRMLRYQAPAQATKDFDTALEQVEGLYLNSPVFQAFNGPKVLGSTVRGIKVQAHAPQSLGFGGSLGWSAVWEHHSGGFELAPETRNAIQRHQNSEFSFAGAA
jgi:hypothetical protein